MINENENCGCSECTCENENADVCANELENNEERLCGEKENEEVFNLKKQLKEKTLKCDEFYNMAQRISAEFDNYKKRAQKEKESIYSEAIADTAIHFLNVMDNFERAMQAIEGEEAQKSIKEGIELVFKQLKDVFKTLSIKEIISVGEKFNPELHNAVMHIEDENYPEQEVIEEFQKGYFLKDKVLRHSMVKVAN